MTWHFCSVYGCSNNERKKIACVQKCSTVNPRKPCQLHARRFPHLENVQFHTFPKDRNLKKQWFDFLRRKDLKLGQITRNHTICSVHFQMGLGYCMADPVPTVYNSPEMEQFSKSPDCSSLKRKAPVKRGNPTSTKRRRINTQSWTKDKIEKSSESRPSVCEIGQSKEGDTERPSESLKRSELHVGKIGKEESKTGSAAEIRFEGGKEEKSSCSRGTQTDLTLTDLIAIESRLQNLESRLQNKECLRRDLFMDQVTESDRSVQFYTGIPSLSLLNGLFGVISPAAQKLKYWVKGESFKRGKYWEKKTKEKTGPKRKLSLFQEFILTLVKLRIGLQGRHLGDIFGISTSSVTKTFITWINFLYFELKHLISWPSKEQINKHRPQCFRHYPKTRVVLDCSEFQVEKPKTPTAQISTWSEYKQRNTWKGLFGISPSGAFSFVSSLWGGSISDKLITKESGILDLLEPGDDVMADRGFIIRDLLTMRKCTLNIPPFSCGKPLSKVQVTKTRRIASARIHVERAIERLKNFKILQNVIPLTMKNSMDQIVTVCCALSNFYPRLAK